MKHLWMAVACFVIALAATAKADQLMEVPTRPGVTVRLALTVPDAPKAPEAIAILFPGGYGHIEIDADGRIKRDSNFLIRARKNFAKFGMVAAAMDAPSDQIAEYGKMPDAFRQGPGHVADVKAVVKALRKRFRVPVWLIGTSRGSTSVAHAAIELRAVKPDDGGPDGIALTASVGVEHRRGGNLLDMKLALIEVPALVVHHEDDLCWATPFSGSADIAARLTGALRRELIMITGGKRGDDVCTGDSRHGFKGQRGQVIKRIVGWIFER